MRGYALAAVIVLLVASCGSDSAETAAGREPAGQAEAVVDPPRVGCPNGPFFPLTALDSAPPLIEDSAVPEVADAIALFLESDEGGFWPHDGWRVLEVAEADQVLLVHPGSSEVPGVAFMSVEWTNDRWRWSGSSMPNDCDLVFEPEPDDGAVVDWEVDPAGEPLGPDTTTLVVLATERGCASGQPMGDRLNEPEISYTDRAVLILLTTRPREGGQDCPGNPSQRVEIALTEPLGQRVIQDARATDLGELRHILPELIDGDEPPADSAGEGTGDAGGDVTATSAGPLPVAECDPESASRVARETVSSLVDRLIEGAANDDFRSAAEVWTGAYAGPDAAGVLQELVESNPWLLEGEIETVSVDSYSDARFCPGQVVAVTDHERRGTFAVLVDIHGTIHRVQRADELPRAPEITSSAVVLPTSPVEGSAVAYLESTRLPDAAITVDREANGDWTVVSVPPSAEGPRLLIVSMATPELSTAYSVIIPG